jgi:MFS family permease
VLPLTLAALTFTGTVRVWHVFVLAGCLGVINAFDLPARQAFLIDMVGREDLMNAIALNSSIFNGARVVGPAVAGLLVAAVGEGWCFLLNGISYLAVIGGLLLMQAPAFRKAPGSGSPLSDIVDGFRFAWRTTPIRALLLLVGVVSFLGLPYSVLMPVFAENILGGGARSLGFLMGAAGLGALAGALIVASRDGVSGLGRWVAIAAGTFGAALMLFALSRSFALSMLVLVVAGGGVMVQLTSSNTLLQAMSPDALRGRVMSVYSMMFMGMAPLGSLAEGWLAERYGAPVTVAVGGAGCIVAAAVFARRLPAIRGEARQLIYAQGNADTLIYETKAKG